MVIVRLLVGRFVLVQQGQMGTDRSVLVQQGQMVQQLRC